MQGDTLMTLEQVSARVAMSRSEIYRRIELGIFPAPLKLGERCSRWVDLEIDEWIQRVLDLPRDSVGERPRNIKGAFVKKS